MLKEPRSGRFFGNFRLKLSGPVQSARFYSIGVFRDSGHIRSPDLEILATDSGSVGNTEICGSLRHVHIPSQGSLLAFDVSL